MEGDEEPTVGSLPTPPLSASPPAADSELTLYIAQRGDTLAGIALQRDMTLRELRTINKLWSDTLWPGQKLRVRRKAVNPATRSRGKSEPAARAGSAASSSSSCTPASASASASTSQPLLVRLRDLTEHHDAMYSHHRVHARVGARSATKVTAASRKYVSAMPPQLRAAVAHPDENVVTVAAVLLRLRPFAAVSGHMTLTSTRLMWVPNLQDPYVRMNGATSLQVDVATCNVLGANRISAADLDQLVEEDVGLQLQEDSPHRFLEVLYKPDADNIVAPRTAKKRQPTPAALGGPEYASLHFMLSTDGLSVVRSQLLQRLAAGSAGSSMDVPTLVRYTEDKKAGDPIPEVPTDLVLLLPHVPALFRGFKQWFLRFSSNSDGLSLTTLRNRVKDVAPFLLFIRTTTGDRFGVYVGDVLQRNPQYFGSNRLFVFRLHAPFAAWQCTMKNHYFLLLNDRGLSVGGDADGQVALFLDSELLGGESHACGTFDNEPLVSSGYAYSVAQLEAYAFEPLDEGD